MKLWEDAMTVSGSDAKYHWTVFFYMLLLLFLSNCDIIGRIYYNVVFSVYLIISRDVFHYLINEEIGENLKLLKKGKIGTFFARIAAMSGWVTGAEGESRLEGPWGGVISTTNLLILKLALSATGLSG